MNAPLPAGLISPTLQNWFHAAVYPDSSWNSDAMTHIIMKLEELHYPICWQIDGAMFEYASVLRIAAWFLSFNGNHPGRVELRKRVHTDLVDVIVHATHGGTGECLRAAHVFNEVCYTLLQGI